MKSELVFIPLPAAGHLASAMQLAKLLVSRDDNLSIRILVFKNGSTTASSHIQSLYAETTEGIQFTELPDHQPEPQPDDHDQHRSINKSNNPFIFLCQLMNSQKPQVLDLVTSLRDSGSSKLAGFVVDMFTTEMMDVADQLELPTYLFFTSGATILGLWLHLQSIKDEAYADEVDINAAWLRDYADREFWIPTYKVPVPAKLFPLVMFDSEAFEMCLKISERMVQAEGIMINTYLDLESHALKALTTDQRTPPVYTIGPLINFAGINTNPPEIETIMKWLDDQPPSSVVFLCFGSLGFFEADQVREMANALENSGCRFLWSLRMAPTISSNDVPPEEVLPEGFSRRTAGTGKVIGWAPQVQVLGHPAVGGFVTHCGWNSVLESVWFGVPMAAWPMYAEQQMNALQIAKDIGVSVEIQMDYNTDPVMNRKVIVRADEIENGIREVMKPESETRKKVKELMGKARSAMWEEEGGSSDVAIGRLMDDLLAQLPPIN